MAAVAAKSFADDASNLIETQNKVMEVFAGSAEGILAWSADSATGFGLSTQAALEAAGNFGNLFTQLGLGTEQASMLSTQMVELAADFASFHNADITQVLVAQQAAFRGEYDALQRFVPAINAALVEERALEMGLAKTTAELSQQDKALATQKLMLEGAGAALGDFDRTSEGAANQQRIFAANVADLRAEIGTALLPVMNDIITAMNDWIATNGDEFAHDLATAIDGTVEAAKDLYDALNDIRNSGPVDVIVAITMTGAGAVADTLEALGKLPGAAADVFSGVAGTIRGIAAGAGRAGGAALALPRSLFGLQRDLQDVFAGRVPTGGFLAETGMLPAAVDEIDFDPASTPEGAGRGIPRPGRSTPAPRAGTGERVPTRASAGGRSGLSELEKEAREAAERLRESFEITEIRNLQLAHKAMEEAELAAAAVINERTKAESALLEQQRATLGFLNGLGQRNVSFAPGVFEQIARAGGLTPIGEFTDITVTDAGGTRPIDRGPVLDVVVS